MKPADFALLVAVCLFWALNLVVTRWTVTEGDVPPLFFAAVLALMAVMEAWQKLRRHPEIEPGLARLVLRYLAGVSATTLVAGAATTPFAAFHFQTIPTYGVLANLVAVPITTFLVMPAGMLGLVLMPLGWEWPFFHAMGLGCGAVLAVARFIAGLPGASILVPQWPVTALALLAAGGLWLALWRRPWRWIGLVPAGLAVVDGSARGRDRHAHRPHCDAGGSRGALPGRLGAARRTRDLCRPRQSQQSRQCPHHCRPGRADRLG